MFKKLEKICRLCLCEEDVFLNIYESQNNILKLSVAESVYYISQILITIDDNLPKLICQKCYSLVEQSVKFKKQIKSTFNYLSNVIVTINENDKEYNNNYGIGLSGDNNGSIDFLKEEFLEEEVLDSETLNNIEIQNEPKEEELGGISYLNFIEPEKIETLELMECPLCLENIANESMEEHLNSHSDLQDWSCILKGTPNIEYFCSICEKKLRKRVEFINHMRRHFLIRPYNCNNDNCMENQFYSYYCMKKHVLKYHDKVERILCEICQAEFVSIIDLSKHKETAHKTIKQKMFSCSYCPVTFSTITNKKLHEKRHLFEGHIPCLYCKKKFYTKVELERHEQIHTYERAYPCDLCKKSFKSKPELNRHKRYHFNDRRFCCHICNKKFIESSHLYEHHKISHLKIKEFSCPNCYKLYSSKTKLKRHQTSLICGNRRLKIKQLNNVNVVNDQLKVSIDIQDDYLEDSINFKQSVDENTTNISNYGTLKITSINEEFRNILGRSVNIIEIKNQNDEVENYIVVDSDQIDD